MFAGIEITEVDVTNLDSPERIISYAQKNGYCNGACTDIERLISDNPELELDFADLGQNDARIIKVAEKRYRITVNSKHPKSRQRFSMAHEYIHYQMHRDKLAQMPDGEQILHRNEERNPIEYEANAGAADILMPKEVFMQVLKETNGKIGKMAEAFQVSTLALRYRAKNLDIPGHGL